MTIYVTSYHPSTRCSAPANKKSEGHQTQTVPGRLFFIASSLCRWW